MKGKIMMTLMIVLAIVVAVVAQAVNVNNKIQMGK
jgi:hypothetical protein